MLALYFLMPNFSATDRSVSVLTSLTLFPSGNPALSVAWTLVFEMFFYIIFSINFYSRKLWYCFLAIWVLGILYTSIFNVEFDNMILKTVFSMYNLDFVLGVLAAYIVRSNFRIKYGFLSIIAWATLLCFLYAKYFEITLFPFFQNLIFVFAASFFVIIGVQYWNKKIKDNNIFMLIGNSSYSLYLLHNPLQSFLVRAFPKSNMQYLILGELIIVVVTIIMLSYVYYLLLEKRTITYVKYKLEPYVS